MVVMVVGRRQERPLRSEGGEGSERLTCEAVKKKGKKKSSCQFVSSSDASAETVCAGEAEGDTHESCCAAREVRPRSL